MRRVLPQGIAGRFLLLLTAALLAANLVALGVLALDRGQQDRIALRDREIERIVSLVPVVEALPREARARVVGEASTRATVVTLDAVPLVRRASSEPQARAVTAAIEEALPGRVVQAVAGERRGGLAISIRLSGDGPQPWLNLRTRGGPPAGAPIEPGALLVVLGLSLVATLGVAWLFLRRLVRPLRRLEAATRAAGRGDRSVRVAEDGASELRALAAAFNAMQSDIARFDAERMRTMGAVGHDLRTPITSLRIRAEMLDPQDGAPMIRTLDEMTVMADGLVAFARGAGEAEPLAPVDLADLLTRLAETRGATLASVVPVQVPGRPVALGRLFGNLVDNALRYGGGARLSLARDGGQAVVTVSDDGPGIDAGRLERMFDPFVRGDGSRSADTGGAGLGLSIARTIAQAHGGEIRLANRPGGGLDAVVRLPI